MDSLKSQHQPLLAEQDWDACAPPAPSTLTGEEGEGNLGRHSQPRITQAQTHIGTHTGTHTCTHAHVPTHAHAHGR